MNLPSMIGTCLICGVRDKHAWSEDACSVQCGIELRAERRIVEWLRGESDLNNKHAVANAIERGDHR